MKLVADMLDELKEVSAGISEDVVSTFCSEMLGAKRVFCVGRGRSGLIAKMFVMRLMHMGIEAYSVDEVVTPSIQAGDLLLICSGSGETASLKAMAQKAKGYGVRLLTITASSDSFIAGMADKVLLIEGYTPKNSTNVHKSIQPMGSQFEQLMLFTLEAIVIELKKTVGISEQAMMARHANLE